MTECSFLSGEKIQAGPYHRRPLDLLRQWHTKIEGWILEHAGIEQPQQGAAVTELRVVA